MKKQNLFQVIKIIFSNAVPYNAKKWLTLAGGIMIHFTLGASYTFANVTPYLTSYLKENKEEIRYSDTNWLSSVTGISMSISSFLIGLLISKFSLNLKIVLFVGCFINSLGVALTFFTIKSSFFLTVLTYGVLNGMGCGIAYIAPLSIAMKWFPESKGKANSAILFGMGAGAIVFNQVQTNYVNSNNLAPDRLQPNVTTVEEYFSQPELLDKVPYMFLILAACYFFMQFIGNLMIFQTCELQSKCDERSFSFSTITLEAFEECKSNLQHSECKLPKINSEINSLGVDYTNSNSGLTLIEVLKKLSFYQMIIMMLTFFPAAGLVTTYYKQFGQIFIKNDKFLSLTGSAASFFNASGRLFWGFLIDKLPFKYCYLIASGLLIIEVSTIYLTKLIDEKIVYLLWVCSVYFTQCGLYVLVSTASAKVFGQKHFNTIYGLMMFTGVPCTLIVSLMGEYIQKLTWVWTFLLGSIIASIGFFVALTFNVKNSSKRNI